MADQIKLRRRQKREKTISIEGANSSSNSTPVCLKCTQQAIGYQHLMSVLDPSNTSETVFNLSAILQACPHKTTSQNFIDCSNNLLSSSLSSFIMSYHSPIVSDVRHDSD
ncbi:hypothetical protein DICVIV_03680 [Dictyocaulus viviparus]|uniref:Uncharacterized protein n=1 Tax=Dictyocaulus viviparus TaxID=29172 RepID=A0A0D8Y1Z4_DICVI|nr:hypothetical protein DICVIV_03680 [Dictyocaulus viviparus]